MTIKTDTNLKAAFCGEEARKEVQAATIPESIRQHAPVPVLKPDGSWKARAQEVERRVREDKAARKANNEWAAKREARHAAGVGQAFRSSARR